MLLGPMPVYFFVCFIISFCSVIAALFDIWSRSTCRITCIEVFSQEIIQWCTSVEKLSLSGEFQIHIVWSLALRWYLGVVMQFSTFRFWLNFFKYFPLFENKSRPAPCYVRPSRTKWVPWSCKFSLAENQLQPVERCSVTVPSVVSAEVLPLVCHLVLQMPIPLVHAWCYPPQWQASPHPDPKRGGSCWSSLVMRVPDRTLCH